MKFKAVFTTLIGAIYGGAFSGALFWISLKTDHPIGLLIFTPIPTGLIIAYTSTIRQATIMGRGYKAEYITLLGALKGLLLSICLSFILEYLPNPDPSTARGITALIIVSGAILGILVLNRQYRQWLGLRARYNKLVALNQVLDNNNLDKKSPASLREKIRSLKFELPKINPYVLIIPVLIFLLTHFLTIGDTEQNRSLMIGISSVYSGLFLIRIYIDYLLIDDYINRHYGNLIFMTWAPFGPGWLGQRSSNIYYLKYKDNSGVKSKYCKAGILDGVYFTDDISYF